MPTPIPPNNLKSLRERSRLTQEEVAKIIGIDFTTVCKHENCDRGLDKDDIIKYAKLYKVETFEIFIRPDELNVAGK